jgi:hypothetical protein
MLSFIAMNTSDSKRLKYVMLGIGVTNLIVVILYLILGHTTS